MAHCEPKGTRRTAHGAAAAAGRLVVSECPPTDELPSACNPDPNRKDRSQDGRFLPGNSWARMAKARAGVGGALLLLEAKADPAWRAARRFGRRAAVHRIREYGQSHGLELSSGVCRMLQDSCQQSADAEYLSARAAADNNPELLRIAAQLRAGARQAERDAWALAVLEAKAKPRPSNGLPPPGPCHIYTPEEMAAMYPDDPKPEESSDEST